MTTDRPTRRRFLAGTASLAAIAGIAGCLDSSGPLEPYVPAHRLEEGGWRRVADIDDEATETVDVAGTTQRVTVQLKAHVYENDEPVRQLADRFGVDADAAALPAELFVAAKARMDPPVAPLLAYSDTLLTNALDIAEREASHQLNEQGFRNIRRVDEGTLAIDAGPTAHHRRYQADYPYESFRVTYQGMPLSIDAGVYTLEAQLAVWHSDGLLVTGAGLYPGETGHLVVTAQGTSRKLSLDFQPDQYRVDVRELIRLIS